MKSNMCPLCGSTNIQEIIKKKLTQVKKNNRPTNHCTRCGYEWYAKYQAPLA